MDGQFSSYEMAIASLENGNWVSGIVSVTRLLPVMGRPICWYEITWAQSNETMGLNPRGPEERHITLIADPQIGGGRAVGTSEIRIENAATRKLRRIYGGKFTETPALLGGANLAAALGGIAKLIRGQSEREEGKISRLRLLEVRADSAQSIAGTNIDRWKQYGAPLTLNPQHSTLDKLLNQMSTDEGVSRIPICPLKQRSGPTKIPFSLTQGQLGQVGLDVGENRI